MQISPFTIAIAEERLAWVLGRLRDARWPKVPHGKPWEFGVDYDSFRDLISHAVNAYDWRAQEQALNRWPQFTATVDGLLVHFLHAKCGRPDALTVITWRHGAHHLVRVILERAGAGQVSVCFG